MIATTAPAVAQAVAHRLALTERSVVALGSAASALDVMPGPATARAVLDTEQQWRRLDEEFGLLDAAGIGRLAGSRAVSLRAWASQKHRDRELLGVRRRNRVLYPGFQLDAQGNVRPAVPAVIAVFDDAGWREESVVLWFVATNGRLGGMRPVDVPDENADRVVTAARDAVDAW